MKRFNLLLAFATLLIFQSFGQNKDTSRIPNDDAIKKQNENTLNGPIALPGGIVSKTDKYYIEFVFAPHDTSHVYLFDENAKPVSNIAILGRIVFQQYNNTTTSLDLAGVNDTSFAVFTSFTSYKSCDVHFEVNGSGILVTFHPDKDVVKK